MNISVVIVTYNGSPWIGGALNSLRSSLAPCTAIVVDNASTDDTVAIVRRDYPEAVLIARAENSGFGIGNNIGIRRAMEDGADYIFLLNQDAFVTPQALGQLADFLEQHPQYSVATPLHCSPDLTRLDPQTQSGYLQRYVPGYLSDACLQRVRPYYDILGINAAAWMVRSAAFERVGGFDPLFFMYGEDDDLIARFAHLGERFALLPTSRIVHLRARSVRPTPGMARQIWNLSERARSDLLMDFKLPIGSVGGKLIRLLGAGLVHPLGRLLSDHDWKSACAYWLATGRVLAQSKPILESAKRCSKPGSHYL